MKKLTLALTVAAATLVGAASAQAGPRHWMHHHVIVHHHHFMHHR